MTGKTELEIYRRVLAHEAQRCGKRLMARAENAAQASSALLSRLRAGLQPLIVPPPLREGHPWYAVVEEAGPHEVRAGFGMWGHETLDTLLEAGHQALDSGLPGSAVLSGFTVVMLEAMPWMVLSRLSGEHAVVSYPGWMERGFQWQLSKEVVPAAQATHFVAPSFSNAIKRITTLEQLRAELRHLQMLRVERIRNALQDRSAAWSQETEQWRRVADQRMRDGLPALPTDQEVEAIVHHALTEALRREYRVASDGASLDLIVWRLRRIAPQELPSEIYLRLE